MEAKVYEFNEYEWIATNWSLEKTIEWYEKEFTELEDCEKADIRECNLDTEGMWWGTESPEDIKRLKSSDNDSRKHNFGDVIQSEDQLFKRVTFREAIKLNGEFDEPFLIASTEW